MTIKFKYSTEFSTCDRKFNHLCIDVTDVSVTTFSMFSCHGDPNARDQHGYHGNHETFQSILTLCPSTTSILYAPHQVTPCWKEDDLIYQP